MILDLSAQTNNTTVTVDLANTASQVASGSLSASNFETISSITTGSGNDTVTLDIDAATSGIEIDGSMGMDTLVLDYSSLGVAILNTGSEIQRADDNSVLLTTATSKRLKFPQQTTTTPLKVIGEAIPSSGTEETIA